MATVRWNPRHQTGDPAVDGRNRALIDITNDLGQELRRKEHCQDMNDVYADLTVHVQARLKGGREVLAAGPDTPGSDAALAELLATRFPLAALSTPACRECGLCDLMQDRVRRWHQGPGGS